MASTPSSDLPAANPAAAVVSKPPEEKENEGSRMRIFVSILRKFIGVTDLASVRFSLPSQLLEPRPNLEYWTYLDAPSAFVAIGASDDPLDRMLEVVRFWLTKDLKYAKGKPCKPYNSCLGEFFRCNWETEDNAPRIDTKALQAAFSSGGGSGSGGGDDVPSRPSSLKIPKGDKNQSSVSLSIPGSDAPRTPTPGNDGATATATATASDLTSAPTAPTPIPTPIPDTVLVSYLTEQTSHHPPVSAFTVSCPARGLVARGYDQITAKFTGTSIKVLPGEHNMGIFIKVDRRGGETYQLTHPAAHLGGLLRGSLTVSVSEMAYITCPETCIKTILHYVEEGWLGRTTNKIDGVVFRYDPEKDDKVRVKDVPETDVLARLSGPWKERVMFTLGPKPVSSHPPESQYTIIEIPPLAIAPKITPPNEQQLPHESLRLWSGVTQAIHAKEYSRATTVKQELEEQQREKARERERTGEEFVPAFFSHVTGNGGQPELTEKGREVLRRAQEGNWSMEGIFENGVKV